LLHLHRFFWEETMNVHVATPYNSTQALRNKKPKLSFKPYYPDGHHDPVHCKGLNDNDLNKLAYRMVYQHGVPPCLMPDYYHGTFVIADRPQLLAGSELYRAEGAHHMLAGIVGIPHGRLLQLQAVLALYTCGQVFKQVYERLYNQPGTWFDVLKVCLT
jgi:hypothetical protein